MVNIKFTCSQFTSPLIFITSDRHPNSIFNDNKYMPQLLRRITYLHCTDRENWKKILDQQLEDDEFDDSSFMKNGFIIPHPEDGEE